MIGRNELDFPMESDGLAQRWKADRHRDDQYGFLTDMAWYTLIDRYADFKRGPCGIFLG